MFVRELIVFYLLFFFNIHFWYILESVIQENKTIIHHIKKVIIFYSSIKIELLNISIF